jgi:hypothetical protein
LVAFAEISEPVDSLTSVPSDHDQDPWLTEILSPTTGLASESTGRTRLTGLARPGAEVWIFRGRVVACPAELVARTRNAAVPTAVGVPESTPVTEFRVMCLGRTPETTEYLGFPVATNRYRYGRPLTAACGEAAVNAGLMVAAEAVPSTTAPMATARTAVAAAPEMKVRRLSPDSRRRGASSPVALGPTVASNSWCPAFIDGPAGALE